jgi:hypothetical protein
MRVRKAVWYFMGAFSVLKRCGTGRRAALLHWLLARSPKILNLGLCDELADNLGNRFIKVRGDLLQLLPALRIESHHEALA